MDLKALSAQIVALFGKFNKQQRYVILGTVVVVVALIAFLIVYSAPRTKGDDGFRTLFSNLSAQDAGLIVSHLEKNKVEYKLPIDGTIEVKKEVVNKVRMDIAAQGLPKESHVGFELFDNQEFGATDFDQQVKFLRALEGELSKTIGDLASVYDARVHIAMPKESVFVSKQEPPSASVVIVLNDQMNLSRKQILGVKYLVSSAVVKLIPENVKIVDENGMPLGEEDELSTAGEVAKMQLRYKLDYERFYEEKIIKMLSPFMGGSEHVVAKVTIEFDFSQRESVQEVYDPNSVPRSEQTLEEKREGFKPKEIGGVPGAVSNIGPVQGIENQQATEKYEKAKSTTNYEISKTTSNVKGAYATVRRITAAVVVDGRYFEDDNASGGYRYEARSPTELGTLSSLVKQAIGYDDARTDEVTVSSFEFREGRSSSSIVLSPGEEFLQKLESYTGPFYPLFKYILLAVVLFIFYKKIIVPFSEKMLELKVDEDEGQEEQHILFEEEEYEDDLERLSELKKKVEQQLGIGGETDEVALRYEVLVEKLRTVSEENAEDVANIITQLLNEETSAAPQQTETKPDEGKK